MLSDPSCVNKFLSVVKVTDMIRYYIEIDARGTDKAGSEDKHICNV